MKSPNFENCQPFYSQESNRFVVYRQAVLSKSCNNAIISCAESQDTSKLEDGCSLDMANISSTPKQLFHTLFNFPSIENCEQFNKPGTRVERFRKNQLSLSCSQGILRCTRDNDLEALSKCAYDYEMMFQSEIDYCKEKLAYVFLEPVKQNIENYYLKCKHTQRFKKLKKQCRDVIIECSNDSTDC